MNNEWTVFATIFSKIQPPIAGWVDQTINTLASQIKLPLLATFVVFIAGYSLIRTLTPDAHPLSSLERKLLRCAIAFNIATGSAAYHQFVADFALTVLPAWLSATLTGGFSSASVQVGAGAFDNIWNSAYIAGSAVEGRLSTWGDIGLHLLVALYWVVSGAVVAAAFGAWLFAYIAIVLLVGIGPVFVAFLAFPATYGMFSRWIGSLLGAVLLQAFIVALLVLVTGAEASIIGQVASAGQDGSRLAGQVVHLGQLLLGGLLLFVVCGYMLFELRGLVAAIVSGGAVDFRPVMAAVSSAATALAMRAGSAARAGVAGTASVGSGAIAAARRSLSSAKS
jgi:type IV secretion system protein VirB6